MSIEVTEPLGTHLMGAARVSGEGVEKWFDFPRYKLVAWHMDGETLFVEVLNRQGTTIGVEKINSGSDQCFVWREREVVAKAMLQASEPTDSVLVSREWISVEDRLPECGEFVIAYHSNHKYINTQHMASCGWTYLQNDPPPEISHWMPLPEPPALLEKG